RMFRYATVAELRNDREQAKRAWCFDAREKKLYVRTGTGKSAEAHAYRVSRHEYGLHLTGGQHVIMRGFTLRHYGNTAVRLSEGAHHCTVMDCTIHNVPCGFFLKTESTRDIAIWRNEIYEPGLADFTWGSIKNGDYPRQGISFMAGRGISVCHNRMHGWFDAVCPESWKHPDQLGLNRDCDVMFNELYNIGDDAVEADGGGVNLRIHGNRIRNAHTAISLAPVERGPLYCTRNDASFRGLMFKLNVAGCTSLGWAYCYHNSGYCLMTGSEGGTAISFPPGIPCTNKVFKNNALIGNEWSVRAGRKGYVLDANCYWHTPGKTPRRFQWEQKTYNTLDDFRRATEQEQHGQYADPLFTACPGLGKFTFGKEFLLTRLADDPLMSDAREGDLQLQAGSPCLDRGAMIRGINDDYRGQAPDIGAFER
ncbi:MAG: right-handed parallel beta-helix repeat-containing protein, partial [Planctomycetia bacterium]|nr:right-handed parallel beta-helix repeat-containing protein [Planctomycetia bacterium]